MVKENNYKNLVIILAVLVVILGVLCVLFATGTISLKDNNSYNQVNNDINPENSTQVEERKQEDNAIVDNDPNQVDNSIAKDEENQTLDKFIGEWYLDEGRYTHLNIKKVSNNSYTIDILVNKMADYKNLTLSCAKNAGVCYASGDENHNFSISMMYGQITVIPDYATVDTIWNFTYR